ncbi:aldo/keto reductase [Streptomyces sp. MMBL 11-3]|uniref:aldo/keto reductase n=1 Tax=Streptomyces sp. MMBL 11-3 TaxID=3382639 RepID=UPI0039B39629
MRHRPLGRTGIQVSPYALGTLMFATAMGNEPEESARIIHKALDADINFVDTADAYGDSEDVVGRALQGRRDSVVLATKFSRPTGKDQDPNRRGASRRWIVTAVEDSPRRLNTDHIDLYQLHLPDPRTDIEETLSTWASWCGGRWARDCSPAASARARTTPCGAPVCPVPTSAPSTRPTGPRPWRTRTCAAVP